MIAMNFLRDASNSCGDASIATFYFENFAKIVVLFNEMCKYSLEHSKSCLWSNSWA
jgi:hypothetical protein